MAFLLALGVGCDGSLPAEDGGGDVDAGCDAPCGPTCEPGPSNPDGDRDGVADVCDACEGEDDELDADADGVPDGCEGSGRFVDNGQYVAFDQGGDLALGDLDGDSDLDAFVLGAPEGPEDAHGRVWLNDGSGTFAESGRAVGDFALRVALGDVDDDGDLDALTASGNGRLWLNEGDATFVDSGQWVGGFYAAALADVDGDGDLDAVGGLDSRPGIEIWVNDGSGVFSNSGALYGDLDVVDVALEDFDGDGDLDVYAAGRISGPVWRSEIWLNDGRGAFLLGSQAAGYSGFVLGDLDGDGDIDAYVVRSGEEGARLNDGAGGFSDLVAPTAAPLVARHSLADFDADGDLDVFEAGPQDRVLLNDGAGRFTPTVQDLGWSYGLAAETADLDGDGDVDVFVSSQVSTAFDYWGHDHVWLNDGAGVLENPVDQLSTLDASGVALGDLDGDGDLDAFVSNSLFVHGASSQLFFNDGGGTFVQSDASIEPGIGVGLGDLDGDGDLDALVGGSLGSPTSTPPRPAIAARVWLNDGSGGFTDSGQTIEEDAGQIVLADVDSDGDLDAIVVGVTVRLWLNDSSAGFGERREITASRVWTFAVGDLDGDGDLDLFTDLWSDSVWLNDGTGEFTPSPGTPFAGVPEGIALGDLDADGDLDAFVSGSPSEVLFNDGSATFAGGMVGMEISGYALDLSDVDGDADLDAFIVLSDHPSSFRLGGPAIVMLNDGAGVFSDSGQELGWQQAVEVALGDLDGDGSPDAFVANRGRDRVWLNE